jgi:D-alanyl-D-alanine carboxypeptidase
MAKIFSIIVLLGILFGCCVMACADDVDDSIKLQMLRRHIPGLSLVVVKDGKVIKSHGYGLANVELNVSASPDTVYPIASVTKPFVASAILLLRQDGKIDLEDKISKYVDNTPDTWKDITIRNLLSHTSGLPDVWNDLHMDNHNPTTPEKIVQFVAAAPLSFVPGEKWDYSNTGYIVLAMIVQKVSGKPFDAFLAERVFQPLDMTATRLFNPDDIVPNRAAGYRWKDKNLRNSENVDPSVENEGDGGLLSTVLDLAKWDAVLDTNELLSSSSRDAMWTKVKLNNGSTWSYGFGWYVNNINGHKCVFHSGSRPGFGAVIWRYPDDKLTVIILENLVHAGVEKIARNVAGIYLPAVASPVYKTIPDTEPQVTALVTAYFTKATLPEPDESLFTPRLFAIVKPIWSNERSNYIGLGPLRSATLVERKAEDGTDRILYRYRLTYDQTTLVTRLAIKNGKVDDQLGIDEE